MKHVSRESGVTLVEIVIALFLLILVAAFSTVSWGFLKDRYTLESQAENIKAEIRSLYFRSISRHEDLYIRFSAVENTYEVINDVDRNGDPLDGSVVLSRTELPEGMRFGRNLITMDTPDGYGNLSDVYIDDETDYFSFYPNGIGDRKKGTVFLTDGDLTCAITVLNVSGKVKGWKYWNDSWKPL